MNNDDHQLAHSTARDERVAAHTSAALCVALLVIAVLTVWIAIAASSATTPLALILLPLAAMLLQHAAEFRKQAAGHYRVSWALNAALRAGCGDQCSLLRPGTVVLGTGVLIWFPDERRSDRYGTVTLSTTARGDAEPIPFPSAPVGARGLWSPSSWKPAPRVTSVTGFEGSPRAPQESVTRSRSAPGRCSLKPTPNCSSKPSVSGPDGGAPTG